MPFKSQAQAKFMFSKHPDIAKRWEREGEAGWKGLPKHSDPGKRRRKQAMKMQPHRGY